MASQSSALQLILQAINAMREAGYTQDLASHAWEHLFLCRRPWGS